MAKIRYNNIDNVSTDKKLKEFRQWREERRRKNQGLLLCGAESFHPS
jgi:hypothetical protein